MTESTKKDEHGFFFSVAVSLAIILSGTVHLVSTLLLFPLYFFKSAQRVINSLDD